MQWSQFSSRKPDTKIRLMLVEFLQSVKSAAKENIFQHYHCGVLTSRSSRQLSSVLAIYHQFSPALASYRYLSPPLATSRHLSSVLASYRQFSPVLASSRQFSPVLASSRVSSRRCAPALARARHFSRCAFPPTVTIARFRGSTDGVSPPTPGIEPPLPVSATHVDMNAPPPPSHLSRREADRLRTARVSPPPPGPPPPGGGDGRPLQSPQPDPKWLAQREQRRAAARNCCMKVLKFFFSNVGLSGMVVLYTVAGGFIFEHLEKTNEQEECNKARERYLPSENTTVYKVWQACRSYDDDDDDVNYLRFEIRRLLEKFRNEVLDLGYDGKNCSAMDEPDGPGYKWNFAGALLFSVTVITTIGRSSVLLAHHHQRRYVRFALSHSRIRHHRNAIVE